VRKSLDSDVLAALGLLTLCPFTRAGCGPTGDSNSQYLDRHHKIVVKPTADADFAGPKE